MRLRQFWSGTRDKNGLCARILAVGCLVAACGTAQTKIFESNSDVGVTPVTGKVVFDAEAGEYYVTGGGENIWGTADAFQFAWKRVSGDMALTADVRFVGVGALAHRKAALMFRQSLDAGSAYADVAVHGDGTTSLQFRPTAGAATQEVPSELKGPVRIRIERHGNTFMLFAGSPGQELKPTGPATVVLQDPVYVGLAMTSHKADLLETAVFSNVKVEALARLATPAPASPPVKATPSAPAPTQSHFISKLMIFDLKTKSSHRIYEAKEVFEAPNWSPDGKYLLINMRGKLFRVNPDGPSGEPEAVKLDPALRCNNDHNLSPDGRLIAISASTATSHGSQVYVASADGSNAKMVVSTVPSYFHGWSPDGKYLAFVGQRDGVFNLFRVPVTGGDEQRLTFKSPYDDGPDYSHDGKWIYFNSNRTGNWDVWRMPADGSGWNDAKAEQVTNDELEDWFPHPSPDGKHLLIFSFPKGTKGHNDRMEGVQLRLMAIPGAKLDLIKSAGGRRAARQQPTRPVLLTAFFGGQGTINVNSWSPDSKRFAYVVYEPIKEGAVK